MKIEQNFSINTWRRLNDILFKLQRLFELEWLNENQKCLCVFCVISNINSIKLHS